MITPPLLDLMMLMGPFQLRLFYDSMIVSNIHQRNNDFTLFSLWIGYKSVGLVKNKVSLKVRVFSALL